LMPEKEWRAAGVNQQTRGWILFAAWSCWCYYSFSGDIQQKYCESTDPILPFLIANLPLSKLK
jgi:hypothetical protein